MQRPLLSRRIRILPRRLAAGGFVFAAALLAALLASAATSQTDLLASGNRAFRAGDYRTAIATYAEAKRRGRTDAALDFNIGVANYHLGQYVEAERALQRAARSPNFAARSWYNLGLTTWARGDTHSAQAWFERVAQGSSDKRLQHLASQALDELYVSTVSPALRRAKAPGVAPGYSLVLAARWGHDDNVFRTPDAPYVDLSDPSQPTITPAPQSAAFAEGDMTAVNTRIGRQGAVLRAAYEFHGRYYPDRAFANADETQHRLTLSGHGVYGRRLNRSFDLRTFVGAHQETNFDPDDGVERISTTEDLSQRFSYWNVALASDYEHEIGLFSFGLRARAEKRDYEALQSVSEYDSAIYLAGADVQFPLFAGARLRVSYDHERRDYMDRRALDATGNLLAGNPTLEYWYDAASVLALFDLGRKASLRVGVGVTERQDRFVGYNDYTRTSLLFGGVWRPVRALRLELRSAYDDYDYPNAFAFDEPQGGARQSQYSSATLSAEWRITRHLALWGELRRFDVDSTDPRFAYTRLLTAVGLKWDQRF